MFPSPLGIVHFEPGSDPRAGHAAERKKAWASRSRTGCLTCRKRRVKCDETTPVCRRCLIGSHDCRYGALIPLGDARWQFRDVTDGRSTDLQDVRLQQRRERRIFVEAEPFDWDFLQTIRYYYSIVGPFLLYDNGEVSHPHFDLARADYYTVMIITTQLGLVAKSHGKYLNYGDGAATSTLWASYARYLQKIIDRVNRNIMDTTHMGKIETITYISHLVGIDLAVESKLWKAHTDGGLAYIAGIGGAQALIELSSAPTGPCSFFIRHAIWHNMMTPALKHSLGYQTYTDEQFSLILHENYFDVEYPFPLALAIVQVHITRLRHKVVTTAITQDELAPIISRLFERLISVDIIKWVQDIAFSDMTTHQALAELHRDVIWLYAILALPRGAMLQWASAQPQALHREPDEDACDYFVRLYTCRMLAAIRAIYPTIPYRPGLGVALTAVGVALASTGAMEDREFVDRCLHEIWMLPVGIDSIYPRLKKLREFWASGKTGWEDCFYEPTPC